MAEELPHIDPGTIVTAADWWNPLTDAVNANSNASETNQTNIKQTNQKLTSVTGRVSTVESHVGDSSSGNSALSDRISTVESRTTDADTGNSALGGRVTRLESTGGEGGGGLPAGALRYRTIRTTDGNVTSGAFAWPDPPEYAEGIERPRGGTIFRLPTRGMYLVIARITIQATINTGNRFILYVEDNGNRLGEHCYPLPNQYPECQCSALVYVADDPVEITTTTWINATDKAPIYLGSTRTALTISYLGAG